MPEELFEDLFRMTQAVAVIDLTAGDGAAALAAVRLRLKYFGLCLTPCHKEHLATRIKHRLINAVATEGDSFYEPSLVSALLSAETAPTGDAKPKAKAKARGKGKQKTATESGLPAHLEQVTEAAVSEEVPGDKEVLADPFKDEDL